MVQNYVIVGEVESNTVQFTRSAYKLVCLAKNDRTTATIVGVSLLVLGVLTLGAVMYYSSHS
jgi:hypothetical protein